MQAQIIYPSLVLVQPRKTRPCLTERLLMGRKESNQTKKLTASAFKEAVRSRSPLFVIHKMLSILWSPAMITKILFESVRNFRTFTVICLHYSSGAMCSRLHKDEDIWPLLDRPTGRRAGTETQDPLRDHPPHDSRQSTEPKTSWFTGERNAKWYCNSGNFCVNLIFANIVRRLHATRKFRD